jgi:Flp pilus assembly protein TadD
MDPTLAVAYNNKGLALGRLGKSKEARQAYKRARQLDYSR